MLAGGDWTTPHLNGIPYLEKPPLQYWATALSYSLFGLHTWSARLWATLLGMLGIGLTWATGRRLWSAREGEYAAVLLLSCPLYFVVSHINTLDVGLAFFLNATLACFLFAQTATVTSSQRGWMLLFWLAMAGGLLQKGLVAAVLPIAALFAYSVLTRQWHFWRRLHPIDGAFVLTVLCVPWLAAVEARNPGFLQFFFIHEHFERFTTTAHHRVESWWFFIAILTVGMVPWIGLITRLRPSARVEQTSGELRAEFLLLLWAAIQLLFFSISNSKLAPYIVGTAAPLCLLAARWLTREQSTRGLLPVVVLSALLWISMIWLGPILRHTLPVGPRQAIYLGLGHWALAAGLLGIVSVAAAWLALCHGRQRIVVLAVGLGFSTALSVLMCGSNILDELRAKPGVAALIAPTLAADGAFYCVGMYWQTLPFALSRTCTVVAWQGELELQFDSDHSHSMASLEQFAAAWQRGPNATAIVAPSLWPALRSAGVQARLVLNDSRVLVIVKP
jgi:4-amino-4-deoxy-L-arabinose transferase-like glycosyltransferase